MPDRASNSNKTGRVSSARLAAYKALRRMHTRDAFANDVIKATIWQSGLDGREKAFAAKLVLGVTQMLGTLDEVLDSSMRSPRDVDDEVRDALRIATYEMLYLEKESYSAVDQGVELVGVIKPRARGAANAILRKVSRNCKDFPYADPDSDFGAFTLSQGFPVWMAQMFKSEMGEQKARAFMRTSNEIAPVYVGVNFAKSDMPEVLDAIEESGYLAHNVTFKDYEVPGCLRLSDRHAVAEQAVLNLIEDGRALIADASAQAIVDLVAKQAISAYKAVHGCQSFEIPNNMSFLELCSGRATKTILFQSAFVRYLNSQLENYTALDNLAFKSSNLESRCKTYEVHVESSITGDASDLDSFVSDRLYDAVFIDSPCTGLGTLRRHVDIRWRATPESVTEHAHLDLEILRSAVAHVVPGGILAYATCTVTNEENISVIDNFLNENSDFSVIPVLGKDAFAPELAPEGPDAHFCTVMQRII